MNGYTLSRKWFNWAFENPDLNTPTHTALYMWILDKWNRSGQKEKISLPTSESMEAIGIKSYNTYKKILLQLIEFGFIEMVQESKNQYTCNIIALSNFDKAQYKADDKALDKALLMQHTKQSESTIQSNDSIYKLINLELLNKETIKLINDNTDLINEKLKSWLSKENKNTKFQKPSLEEISIYLQAYCQSKELSFRDFKNESERFYNYYTANGWKVGKNAMKDWQSAFRNWLSNSKQYQNGTSKNTTKYEPTGDPEADFWAEFAR